MILNRKGKLKGSDILESSFKFVRFPLDLYERIKKVQLKNNDNKGVA